MARKTISMTIGTGIDEQLNALSEQYGLNKSSLVNRILQRTFAAIKPWRIRRELAV